MEEEALIIKGFYAKGGSDFFVRHTINKEAQIDCINEYQIIF